MVLVFAFALGMLVGQHWPRSGVRSATPTGAEAAKRATSAPRRSGLVEPIGERPPQEKLTFYETLTAPLDATSPAGRLGVGAKPESPKPRPAAVTPAAAPVAPRADKSAPTTERPAPPRSSDGGGGDWAVQVGVFKDRSQAEGVRRPLAAAGHDAYVSATSGPDGRMTYRVRVGGFKSRDEAQRVAARVRQERSLPTFVTSR